MNKPFDVSMRENMLPNQAILFCNNWEIMDKNPQSYQNIDLGQLQQQSIPEYFEQFLHFPSSFFFNLQHVYLLTNAKYADIYEYQSVDRLFFYICIQ